MKNILIALVLCLSGSIANAVNVQQFARSNSLTYEMIEDTRLSSSHVVNHYKWLFNLGVSYVDQPLTVKNSNNTEQFDSIIDSMTSVHLGAAIYLKPYWQIAINTSFSHFENNLDETTSEFQDIDLKTKIRIYDGKRNAFSLMPIVSIPLKGGNTEISDNSSPPVSYGNDHLLSDTGYGLGLFAIYEHLFRHFQMSFNLGYKVNSGAKFVDSFGATQIDKTQVLTAGLGLYYPFHKKVGLNLELLSNYTAPFFNDDLNPTELFVGLSAGMSENIHGFAGVGFGNLFSSSDGNDYRIVAGLKFTPGTQPEKDYSQKDVINVKPSRIIEDNRPDCKTAMLFGKSNSFTVLFAHDSYKLSMVQINKINKILEAYKSRSSDVEKIEIYGHTSTVGKEAYNESLGQQRAEKIKSILLKSGISSSKISTNTSMGEILPLEEGDLKSNHKINRRSEVKFVLNNKFRNCYE